MHSMLALALAVLTAATNAASNILQRRANMDEPPELGLSPRLVLNVVRKPVWLAGFAAIIVSFLLQACALDLGRLAAIQPVVILELPMTLVGAVLVFHSRLAPREWVAAGLLTVGVVALVGGLSPADSTARITPATWLVGLPLTLVAVAGLTAAAGRRRGQTRGLLLGAAAGIAFGLTAALMKAATGALNHGGVVGLFAAWQTYVTALVGILAMFLTQHALNAGRLVAAQPGITLLDPLTAILWGAVGFHEHVNGGAWLVLSLAGGVVMVAGAVLLSRAEALEDAEGDPHPVPAASS